ncbi:MAG: HEAT repeat domain-containing protein [Planctomycetota bacterium]
MFRALFLLALVGAVANAGDTTANLAWEGSTFPGTPPLKLSVSEEKPEGLKLPEFARKPLFTTLSLGESTFGIILEIRMARPRTWFDLKGDKDFSKATPSTWKEYETHFDHARTFLVKVAGQETPESVRVIFSRPKKGAKGIDVEIQAHRRGTAVLGGRVRAFALRDDNGDLLFDGDTDKVIVDLDGDGFLDERPEAHEIYTVGQSFRAGKEGYKAKPVASGATVTFSSASPPKKKQRLWRRADFPPPGRKPKRQRATLSRLVKKYEAAAEGPAQFEALRILGEEGSGEAMQYLLKIYEEGGDPEIQLAAVRAMGNRWYKPDFGYLESLIKNESDPQIQATACDSLHLMDGPNRKELYYELIRKTREPVVVEACARNLAYLGKDEAETGVVAAAQDLLTKELRFAAYKAIPYFRRGPPLQMAQKAVRSRYVPMRAAGLRDLNRMGMPEAAGYAFDMAKKRNVPSEVGLAIVEVLGPRGDKKSVAALLGLARFEDGRVMAALRRELSLLRSADAVKVYVDTLKNKTPRVRALAAEMLAPYPDKIVTTKLLRLAEKEKESIVLDAVLDTLGQHPDSRVVEKLLKSARSNNPATRAAGIRSLVFVGLKNPSVKKLFLRLFESSRWQDRLYALDAAAEVRDPTLAPSVAANLDHKRWPVRHLAAIAAGRIRSKDLIEPMIAQLEKDESRRVRASLSEALFLTTGQHFYDFVATWRKWWTKEGATFEVPKEFPEKAPERKSGTTPEFFGVPLDSGRIVFLIDRSGSMRVADTGDVGLSRLKASVKQVGNAVGRLKNDEKVNVIFFDHEVHPWRKKLQELDADARKDLKAFLKGQNADKGTNLFDALEMALWMKEVDTIIILSDGLPQDGRYVMPRDILRQTRRWNRTLRITIHTISMGRESALMRDLAGQTGGRYLRW